MKKCFSILFILLVFSNSLFSKDTNPDYVKKFSKKFSIKSTVETNKLTYSLTPIALGKYSSAELKAAKINSLAYVPFTTSLSLSFWLISLSHTFQFTDTYFNKSNRVETTFRNYELTYYGKVFCLESYYQDYKKLYYGTGTQSNVANSTLNNDLGYFQVGLKTFFIFNGSKYSYNAAFNQSAFQIKPAGSFMLLTSIDYNQLKDKTGYLASIDSSNIANSAIYANIIGLNRNTQINFNLLPGYAYTLVHKSIYLALAQYVGLGLQAQNYKQLSKSNSASGFCLASRSKCALGYNGKKIYTGVYFNSYISNSRTKNRFSTFQNRYNTGVFLGFRIIKEKQKK